MKRLNKIRIADISDVQGYDIIESVELQEMKGGGINWKAIWDAVKGIFTSVSVGASVSYTTVKRDSTGVTTDSTNVTINYGLTLGGDSIQYYRP